MVLTLFPCLNPKFSQAVIVSSQGFYFSPNQSPYSNRSYSSFCLVFLSSLLYIRSTVRYQTVVLPITVYGLFTFVFSAATSKYLTGIRKYTILEPEKLTIWTILKSILAVVFASIAGVLVGL